MAIVIECLIKVQGKMVTLSGSHATTQSAYASIVANGFLLDGGRGGTGVYFWAKSKKYIDLAKAWYDMSVAKGWYSTSSDKRCIIILVSLTAMSLEILDLEEQRLKDAIDDLAERRRVRDDDEEAITRLYDLFISSLEKKMGVRFLVVRLRVAKPPEPYLRGYSVVRLGAPESFVARDPSIIKRERVLGHNYEELNLQRGY